MKYIFVNQATRYLFIDIINRFASNGQKVELITGEIRESDTKVSEEIKKKIFIKYDNSAAFKRFFSWLVFTIQVFFYLMFRNKRKIELILVSTPPFLPLLGIFFNFFFKIPFNVIVYDVYPDVLVSFKIFKKNSIIIKIWNYFNRKLYNRASNIFTISSYMAELLLKQGCDKDKLNVINNWVDSKFIRPIDKSNNFFLKQHNLENKFVIIYSGNMGTTHDIESLVYAAEKLTEYRDIHFLIIGEGIKREKIEKMVVEKSLYNTTLLPLQASNVLPYSLSSGELAYITLDEGAENASVPSKLYYMIAAGCGIITVASSNSELASMTNFYNFGEVIKPGDIGSICKFILDCKMNNEKLIRLRKNARKASLDFTPENAKQFYNAIVNV